MELAVIAVILLAVIGFIYGSYAASKRRSELLAWAQSNGWDFQSDSDRNIDGRFPHFPCLHRGSNRYARNIISGAWDGQTFLAFDYHYTTGSGKNRTHHHFSALILVSQLALKPLLIRPEGFFDKVTEFLGFDDIDFESAEFSRKFYVSAPDKKWAYDVLHQRTMEFLLTEPTFSIQFDSDCIIAWRDCALDAPQFQQAAQVVRGILDRLPDYLIRQQSS